MSSPFPLHQLDQCLAELEPRECRLLVTAILWEAVENRQAVVAVDSDGSLLVCATIKRLADQVGKSERSIQRYARRLQYWGLITQQIIGNNHSRWRLQLTDFLEPEWVSWFQSAIQETGS